MSTSTIPSLSAPARLVVVETTQGCGNCQGSATVHVVSGSWHVGTLRSVPAWHLAVPAAIEDHPATPHYDRDWLATDVEGGAVDVPTDTLHFAADAMLRLARAERIPVRATTKAK